MWKKPKQCMINKRTSCWMVVLYILTFHYVFKKKVRIKNIKSCDLKDRGKIFPSACMLTFCNTIMTNEYMCSYTLQEKNGTRHSCF